MSISFPVYKKEKGEVQQRQCYAVDYPSWQAQGWSKDPDEAFAPGNQVIDTPSEKTVKSVGTKGAS